MQVDLSYLGLACMSSHMYVRHVQIDWLGLHDDLACWLVVLSLHDSVASLQVNSSSRRVRRRDRIVLRCRLMCVMIRDDSSIVDKEKRPYGKGTVSDSCP